MKRGSRILGIGLAAAMGAVTAGCSAGKDTGQPKGEGSSADFVQTTIGIYEAEEAVFSGNVQIAANPVKEGYSGTGYVEGFEADTDSCTFTVTVPETGFYDLNFVSASSGGEKHNYVSIDGISAGTVYVEESGFTDSGLTRVYLEAGEHEVSLSKYWGWISLDYLEVLTSVPIDNSIYEVNAGLCNPNASDEAKRLYSYLCDIYGEKFLSGQFCDTGQNGKEFQVIKGATGRTPAVLGLDFMEYTPSRVENGSKGMATEFAINFWENGGIVTFCWHWNAPSKYLTGQWYSGFYKEYTNIDLAKIMNGEDTEGYDLLMKDIDAIAEQLLILKEAKVPVLWRPLHEASGGWFWWGASGPEAYKQLYILLYERLTNEYGLDNLIWVWNGQDAAWYPGDEYVDIIGEDIYPGERVYNSQIDAYLNAAVNYSTETKLVYMTENGCVFDPELAKRDGAMWGMWCTWSGEFVAKDVAIFTLSEQYTEESMLIKAYEDEDVVTLESLPDLKTYEIRKDLK